MKTWHSGNFQTWQGLTLASITMGRGDKWDDLLSDSICQYMWPPNL